VSEELAALQADSDEKIQVLAEQKISLESQLATTQVRGV